MRLVFLTSSLLASLLFITSSRAADWTVLPGSTLGFSSTFQGEAFTGKFKRFSPQIRFDPNRLGDSRFDVRIDLSSADTRNSERDEMLRSSDFFDIHKFAEARFVASRFRALGGNHFVADGTLSLRGISKPVALSFDWSPGSKPVLNGQASLKRLDFAVGSGDWTDTDLLPNEVKVSTRLLLLPTASAPAALKAPLKAKSGASAKAASPAK